MIYFNGLFKKDKVCFLSFKNDKNQIVNVPLDEVSYTRVSRYLEKISLHDDVLRRFDEDDS